MDIKDIKITPWINPRLSRTALSILDLFKEKGQWTSAEIAAALKLNIETVKKSVKSLVNAGYLIKRGITRGAWYEEKNYGLRGIR